MLPLVTLLLAFPGGCAPQPVVPAPSPAVAPAGAPTAGAPTIAAPTSAAVAPVSLGVVEYRDRRVEVFVGGGFEVRDPAGAVIARGASLAELEAYDAALAEQVRRNGWLDASGYTGNSQP